MTLVEYLSALNRKERYFLIAQAVCGKPSFDLADSFRQSLSWTLGVDVPAHAYCAMDYHLDWLYVALLLAQDGHEEGHIYDSPEDASLPPLVMNANQEDMDLLVAFEEDSLTHVIIVEAKADTGWTNKQLLSKSRRLSRIFDPDVATEPGSKSMAPRNASRYPAVRPHFLLMSPRQPSGIDVSTWPEWMRKDDSFHWLGLNTGGGRLKIQRIDESGANWKVVSLPAAHPQAITE